MCDARLGAANGEAGSYDRVGNHGGWSVPLGDTVTRSRAEYGGDAPVVHVGMSHRLPTVPPRNR